MARSTARHHASGEVAAINKTALVDLMGEGRRTDKMAGIDRALSTVKLDGGRLMAKPGGRSSVLVWWKGEGETDENV